MTRSLQTTLAIAISVLLILWLAVPFAMAVLWSLVDPGTPWGYPDILPPKLSFGRWVQMWQTTGLKQAMLNSYVLAPVAGIVAVILSLPVAYAFGRLEFPGRGAAQVIMLLPIVLPGFVTAIFLSSILVSFGLHDRYIAILIGHVILFMPFATRILSVSFAQVREDVIHAARDLGASRLNTARAAFLPVLKPGLSAAFLIVFVLSIEEFALSFVIGSPDYITIPTILYSYLGYDFIRPNAAVVALILVVPNVALMLVLERLLQSANPANVSGKG